MRRSTVWLWKSLVLAMHEELLVKFGGSAGVRDEGLLESALAAPETTARYQDSTDFELAARYAARIIGNHPFIDGNKRTGFTAAVLFLELNGWRFIAKEPEATVAALALTTKELSEEQFARWLEENCVNDGA